MSSHQVIPSKENAHKGAESLKLWLPKTPEGKAAKQFLTDFLAAVIGKLPYKSTIEKDRVKQQERRDAAKKAKTAKPAEPQPDNSDSVADAEVVTPPTEPTEPAPSANPYDNDSPPPASAAADTTE